MFISFLLNLYLTYRQEIFQEPHWQEAHALASPDTADLTTPGHVLKSSACIRAAKKLDCFIEIEKL